VAAQRTLAFCFSPIPQDDAEWMGHPAPSESASQLVCLLPICGVRGGHRVKVFVSVRSLHEVYPPWGFGGSHLFSMGWRKYSVVRAFFFRNMEGKSLKLENLELFSSHIASPVRSRWLFLEKKPLGGYVSLYANSKDYSALE